MKALVTVTGRPFEIRLETVPAPVPREDEVLVEVRAAAVNRADVLLAAHRPAGSQIGLDVAGEVVRAAADGSGPQVGTRVTGLTDCRSWAELAPLRTDRLARVPDGVSAAEAAALPVAGLTALYALRRRGWLLGRTVLITAAGGGVGRLAVQLAAAAGARVLAVVGSPERAAGLAGFGAEVLVGYDRALDEAVDVLVDSVGGEAFANAYASLAPGGMAVVFGNTTREDLRLPPDWGHARPGIRIEYLFLLDEIRRCRVDTDLTTLLDLVAAGRLDPQVASVRSWLDAASAARDLLDRKVNGKVVLTV
jgi:NADPH:quinone reductase